MDIVGRAVALAALSLVMPGIATAASERWTGKYVSISRLRARRRLERLSFAGREAAYPRRLLSTGTPCAVTLHPFARGAIEMRASSKATTRMTVTAGTLVCLVAMYADAAAEPVMHYVNSRFGFSVDIPSELIPERPPDNGDGRGFHAAQGGMRLTVSGIGNALEEDLSGFVAEDLALCRRKPPDYLIWRPNWVVFSCTTRDGILYQKTIQSGRGTEATFVNLRIHYPADEQARWKEAVTRASTSLRLTSPDAGTR
jgi:hypothetical protein